MYYIYYGNQVLHDPYGINEFCYDVSCSGGLNDKGSMTFTINQKHPLYGKLKMKSEDVIFVDDDITIFSGYISSVSLDFNKELVVTAIGDLNYLNDVLLRPYSTYAIEDSEGKVLDIPRAPNSTRGLLSWYIQKYNEKATKPFQEGLNEIPSIGDVVVNIYNQNYSSVASEIENNLVDNYGGYISARYENGVRYIDYAADVRNINSQIIDFGVNLMDFYQEKSVDDIYTAVIPIGRDDDGNDITLASYPDGRYENEYYVEGDALVNREAVQLYGYKEVTLDAQDFTKIADILKYAYTNLKRNSEPISNITAKAVDLALYMEKYKHLRVGEIVRIRSYPHDVDEYMVVSEIDINMDNPENTEYTLGIVYDTLTGEQSSKLRSLNSSLNRAVDEVDSISEEAKAAAKSADEALKKADSVVEQFDDFKSSVDRSIQDLKDEFDGAIMTWFYDYVPTNDNEPAIEWKDEDTKYEHLGDLFYDTETGYCYRWMKNQNGTYQWSRISDTDITKALETASKAQDTADSKRRIFYEQPKPPYDEGDLWCQGENGNILVCKVPKALGSSFDESDWGFASKYDKAVFSSEDEFYQSDSPTELIGGNWSKENIWVDGKYTWSRTLITYGDGSTEYSPNEDGVCISGNTGPQGPQGIPGLQGIQGEQGEQGLPGPAGDDGRTSYFHIKYSDVPNPTSVNQMKETPSKYIGTCVDFNEKDPETPYAYTWSQFEGDPGENGIPGTNGADGKTSYLHIAYANSADGRTGFSVSDSTNKLYIGQYTDFVQADSTDPTKYSWTLIKGADGTNGKNGENGKDGVGVKSSAVTYQSSTSGTTVPTGSWSTTIPTVAQGSYLWTRTIITYTDNTTTTTYSVGRMGENGTNGTNGTNGKDGTSVTITSTSITYQVSTSGTTTPTGSWSTTIPTVAAGSYLWTKTVVTYSDGKSTTSYSVSRNGTDGIDGANASGINLFVGTKYGMVRGGNNSLSAITIEYTEDSNVPSGHSLKYSCTPSTNSNSGVYYSYVQGLGLDGLSKLISGETYTLSFYAKVGSGTRIFNQNSIAESQTIVSYSDMNVTTSWKLFKVVFKWTNTTKLTASFYSRASVASTDPYELYISSMKLEIGDIENPVWSPSPEDLISGENLVLNSDIEITDPTYLISNYQLVDKYELNTMYSVIIWGDVGSDRERFTSFIGTGASGGSLYKISDGIWACFGYYKASWSSEQQEERGNRLLIYQPPSSNTLSASTIRKIKMVKGIPTELTWSQAPSRGNSVLKVTTAPTMNAGTIRGVSFSGYFRATNVTSQSGDKYVLIGDIIEHSYNHYAVVFVDYNSDYVYVGPATSIKGADGAPGKDGTNGTNGTNGKDGKMLYGTSNTAAATAAKANVGTIDGFTLATGTTVSITFTYANTATSPTLDINNTGAKPIFTNGVRYAYWEAGQTVIFVYDGTNYRVASTDVYANTTTIGNPVGQNVYIDSDSIDIREGNVANSTFTSNSVELGRNSSDSTIKFSGGKGELLYAGSSSMPGIVLRSAQTAAGTNTSPLIITPQNDYVKGDLGFNSQAFIELLNKVAINVHNPEGAINLYGSTVNVSGTDSYAINIDIVPKVWSEWRFEPVTGFSSIDNARLLKFGPLCYLTLTGMISSAWGNWFNLTSLVTSLNAIVDNGNQIFIYDPTLSGTAANGKVQIPLYAQGCLAGSLYITFNKSTGKASNAWYVTYKDKSNGSLATGNEVMIIGAWTNV